MADDNSIAEPNMLPALRNVKSCGVGSVPSGTHALSFDNPMQLSNFVGGWSFFALAQSGRGDLFSRGSLDFRLKEVRSSVPIYPSLKACRAASVACGMGFVTENNSADKLCVSDKKEVV